jgi:hypothetical protein
MRAADADTIWVITEADMGDSYFSHTICVCASKEIADELESQIRSYVAEERPFYRVMPAVYTRHTFWANVPRDGSDPTVTHRTESVLDDEPLAAHTVGEASVQCWPGDSHMRVVVWGTDLALVTEALKGQIALAQANTETIFALRDAQPEGRSILWPPR